MIVGLTFLYFSEVLDFAHGVEEPEQICYQASVSSRPSIHRQTTEPDIKTLINPNLQQVHH